jgi:methionyl-tRNA synthetase
LRIAGILLQPIMPTKASLVLDQLGVKPEKRTLEYAAMGKDLEYGIERPDARLAFQKRWDALFPPAPSTDAPNSDLIKQVNSSFKNVSRNKVNRMASMLAIEASKGEEETAKWMADEANKKMEKTAKASGKV